MALAATYCIVIQYSEMHGFSRTRSCSDKVDFFSQYSLVSDRAFIEGCFLGGSTHIERNSKSAKWYVGPVLMYALGMLLFSPDFIQIILLLPRTSFRWNGEPICSTHGFPFESPNRNFFVALFYPLVSNPLDRKSSPQPYPLTK